MGRISNAIATGVVGSVLIFSAPAEAGLIGAGRTVQVFYYIGTFASREGKIAVGAASSDPASLATPVDYQQGAADGSTIHIGDTQIMITNLLSGLPFCLTNTVGTACMDQIDGFDFTFTGENILGVTVDAASAPGFLPLSGVFQGNTHLGLQLLSQNQIRVDVTGDLPLLNDRLILNPTFATTPPPSVPEPGTLALLGLASIGLIAMRRRRPSNR